MELRRLITELLWLGSLEGSSTIIRSCHNNIALSSDLYMHAKFQLNRKPGSGLKENETFGPTRKELRCDLKNYNFFFIFRIAINKLIDILEVEKNEKKIRFRFLID